MLQAVKRLVGADRDDTVPPALDRAKLNGPVTAARQRLEAAQAEHAQSIARAGELSSALDAAQAAFDLEASESNADRIADTKRDQARHELFAARTQRAAVAADSTLREAEKARDTALLANLDERYNGAATRVAALWRAKGLPALTAFSEFLAEAEAIINDARAAAVECAHIRREDAHPANMALVALRTSSLAAMIEHDMGPAETLRLSRLFV